MDRVTVGCGRCKHNLFTVRLVPVDSERYYSEVVLFCDSCGNRVGMVSHYDLKLRPKEATQ